MSYASNCLADIAMKSSQRAAWKPINAPSSARAVRSPKCQASPPFRQL